MPRRKGQLDKKRRHRWIETEEQLMRDKYPHRPGHEIASELGIELQHVYGKAHRMGLEKSEDFKASPMASKLRRGGNIGAAFRFPKGHVPANKGLRRPGYGVGRMRETQFVKGQRPRNYLPVGTIQPNADGYLRIKISDAPEPPGQRGAKSPNWEFVHKRVWEAAHGPIPKGHRIWWKDRNHSNCALENLELLSEKDHMARTTIHTLPPEIKRAITALTSVKRVITALMTR
jgi:hypothetical protein